MLVQNVRGGEYVPEMASAAPAEVIASGSGWCWPSKLMSQDRTCVSTAQPFGSMGLSGLSVNREMIISLMLGLPSLLK